MNESLLVNTLGHSAGVLIFGIFLVLLLRDRAARRPGGGVKSMLAALLALVWNLASLIVLGSDSPDTLFVRITIAIGFSVLSLLPAVLFDLCLERRYRPLVRGGYALSALATALHIAELFRENASYHRWALTSITLGFGVLTLIAAVFVYREEHDRATTSRLVGTMSLFLLAMSFVHLGSGHAQQIWSQELAFHHAAIPLALLVLLQDYRFVLLDAFFRFLANVLLAAVFVFGAVEAWRLGLLPAADTPFHTALLMAGACLVLVLFALARSGVQRALTRLIFRRPNEEALLRDLKTPIRSEDEYVALAATRLGEFMGAPAEFVPKAEEPEDQGAEAVVALRTGSGGWLYVRLGRRTGGRRYLSEDLQALGRAAAVIGEQLEQHRDLETRRLVAQAELRALQSQIHPHFLFNALNTLYGIIPREARGARDTVLNLADIFRYFLETKKTLVPLEEEMHIVKAYLDVERLRLGDKLQLEISVTPEAQVVPIPILSIQPLVENAVKHGIAPQAGGGLIQIHAGIDANGSLVISVRDTGPGFSKSNRTGVGLENVERRLELCYGGDARLTIESSASGSEVSVRIPAASPRPVEAWR
ncbi:MAG: signal transduction histidine kinase, LytS [Bryobacterales bacterium]|nr:signal transduction histidine kinase, LytS [Bryobacterales bacterium]